jgi:DNA-binding beta-propeller fold protein YncE
VRHYLGAGLLLLIFGCSLGHAADFRQTGSIIIPGPAINSFGVLVVDAKTGLGFLADKDNKALVIFDAKTDSFVARVSGFVGAVKDGNLAGPNGIVVVDGDQGGSHQVWVSDGDSTIKIVDPQSRGILETIPTGGKRRANGMAYDPQRRVVLVANSNDDPPFLSVISTAPGHGVVARTTIDDSAENIERSVHDAKTGAFYTVIPVLKSAPGGGGVLQINAATGQIDKTHALQGCHPHSLSLVSETTLFLGCSSAHGANSKPGGDMAIFDIPSGKITQIGSGLGGNGASSVDLEAGLYFHSGGGDLKIIDVKSGMLVQQVRTSAGARSIDAASASHKVYVATSASTGPCGGCIQVYSAH